MNPNQTAANPRAKENTQMKDTGREVDAKQQVAPSYLEMKEQDELN